MKVDTAKPQRQISRNGILHRAEELIKAHPSAQGKSVQIEWGKAKTDRSVSVDKTDAFLQKPTDLGETFLGAFADLHID